MTQNVNSAPVQAAPAVNTVAITAASAGTHSPGLWALAWRRLRADRIAMLALTVVGLYLIMLVLSASGLVAKDWAKEVGVNYAPPTFIGAQTDAERGFSSDD